jgi:hypothetical protein
MTERPNTPRPAGRRGVTLIEAVLYIAIALALIVGGLVFYRQASFAASMNSFNRLLSAVVAEVRIIARDTPKPSTGTVFLNTSLFEGMLIARESVPSAYLDMTQPAAQRIITPLGGRVGFNMILAPSDEGGSSIFVVLSDLPVAACARLAANSAAGQTSFATNLEVANSSDDIVPPPAASARTIGKGQTIGASSARCKESDLDGDGKVNLNITFRYVE